jgi:hypothetical protein
MPEIASSELMIPSKLIVVPCAIFIPVGNPTTEAQGLDPPKELYTPCAQFSNVPL